MLQHAFLIMVHKSPELLSRIVHVLAKQNHHFFIHVDKKTKNFEQYKDTLADVQNVTFIKRISVFHGAVSQIYCELNLYWAAMNSYVRMDYFHLISGQDYPLRTNEQFDDFFDNNIGKSFAAIEGQAYHDICMKRKYPLRTDVYYPNGNSLIGRIFRRLTTNIQLKLHVRHCLSNTWGGGTGARYIDLL